MGQSLTSKIIEAKNWGEMEVLRDEVMKAGDSKIIKQWCNKYLAMKKCPTCGRVNE